MTSPYLRALEAQRKRYAAMRPADHDRDTERQALCWDLIALVHEIADDRAGDHAQRVGEEVWNRTGDHVLTAAAILHDTLEDGLLTLEQIREITAVPLGLDQSRCLAVVQLLTHPKGEPYQDYITRVCQDPGATQVKFRDILDNLSDDPTAGQLAKYGAALQLISAVWPKKTHDAVDRL